ncbi:DUF983 domain-containing protein [Lichenibacterium ramalinae]|uniref:DUF983 domain-containing protein n=1 Tax=Lichenibacterium ramalinae TaxID=2316527 RepID=A0A4Q2RIA5_9HYPH|nr:DUF983 domain-containing protein [Lichenibacterium ramalinae]RYB07000.1 DUF983 domain-containing protein [Lichenibacterium ramalinae]
MTIGDGAAVSPASAAMAGRCPRCGRGRLFRSFLDIAERCDACGLSYAFADAGDGPAVFVSFAALIVVVALALVIDAAYEPPIWLLMLIILPLVPILCLGMLRPIKGLMIGLQYRNKAGQGRIGL